VDVACAEFEGALWTFYTQKAEASFEQGLLEALLLVFFTCRAELSGEGPDSWTQLVYGFFIQSLMLFIGVAVL
jgi:hypothetical protein